MEALKVESLNSSGVWPMEYKVLVRLDDIAESDPVLKSARLAGIELPDPASEREQMSQVKGVLVAAGGNAFEDWKGRPHVGNRVMIGLYVGLMVKGEDGKEYRLCNDKDIAAVLG